MDCDYCQKGQVNKRFGDPTVKNSDLVVVCYGDEFYLGYGTGYYDEYDSYTLEAKIEFCPKCGRKLV